MRNWLAGDRLTYADLAAAAHISCADFLGDVPWDEDEAAKHWYAAHQVAPAFRPLLADRAAGHDAGGAFTPNSTSEPCATTFAAGRRIWASTPAASRIARRNAAKRRRA